LLTVPSVGRVAKKPSQWKRVVNAKTTTMPGTLLSLPKKKNMKKGMFNPD
jgi:hypothetical protein